MGAVLLPYGRWEWFEAHSSQVPHACSLRHLWTVIIPSTFETLPQASIKHRNWEHLEIFLNGMSRKRWHGLQALTFGRHLYLFYGLHNGLYNPQQVLKSKLTWSTFDTGNLSLTQPNTHRKWKYVKWVIQYTCYNPSLFINYFR